MHVSDRLKFTSQLILFQPKSSLDTFADVMEGSPGNRLGSEELPGIVRREGEDQLEILTVCQSVFEWSAVIRELVGIGVNRNAL